MPLTFRRLALFCTLLCFVLALVWGVAAERLLTFWDIPHSEAAALMGRRIAALLLGVGVMFFSVRDCPPSPARAGVVRGFMVGCLAMAFLGLYDWLSGHAGPGILISVVAEFGLGLAFISVGNGERAMLRQIQTSR
ncbi:hypothetical protein PMM47T1_13740 [Pseudomonas sp. M47T1]|uniref:hypothetical protein n=1 Tax=unclassified Pseudomonas TaxID=196821 RepID=UPI00026085CF|nr:hypothetical protein [Pseudomonas sp. M47T1]EIK96026.1 hypothetical protein PMM47T1_13740 [Pseudomonas sp. M47T1]